MGSAKSHYKRIRVWRGRKRYGKIIRGEHTDPQWGSRVCMPCEDDKKYLVNSLPPSENRGDRTRTCAGGGRAQAQGIACAVPYPLEEEQENIWGKPEYYNRDYQYDSRNKEADQPEIYTVRGMLSAREER